MNFLFGGAETDPVTQYSFKLLDLVRFHGLSPSWRVLYNLNEKFGERISRLNSYEDLIKNRMFHGLTELKNRMDRFGQEPYSRLTIEEAIKVYKDKEDTFSDLNKMKGDLEKNDELYEDMMNFIAEVDPAWGGEGLPDELADKGMILLYGEKWLEEIDEKINFKMTVFTEKLFDLDIWDFDATISAFIEEGD